MIFRYEMLAKGSKGKLNSKRQLQLLSSSLRILLYLGSCMLIIVVYQKQTEEEKDHPKQEEQAKEIKSLNE